MTASDLRSYLHDGRLNRLDRAYAQSGLLWDALKGYPKREAVIPLVEVY